MHLKFNAGRVCLKDGGCVSLSFKQGPGFAVAEKQSGNISREIQKCKTGSKCFRKKEPTIPPRAVSLWQGEAEVSADPMLKPRDICPVLIISTRKKHREVFTLLS